MRILVALLFAAVFPLAAQTPQVPHKMEFAGITLTIRDDARREIQKDVDALTQSPKHYAIKVERARSYFPIIEKIFAEEQLPDDFKYLALQESALIADAVSSSNAVGFWQFKDFTAIEMGLRVDRQIDERLNIASSSRAAARYIKKNNTFFDNWIYALQAYQMGAGGVMRSVKDTKAGASHMEITSQTYWYVKKFLAHKIAYEPAVAGKGQVELVVYPNSRGKSLKQIATEVGVDEEQLVAYNKWTKSGQVPDDRTYVVAVPVMNAGTVSIPVFASNDDTKTVKPAATSAAVKVQTEKKRINSVLAIKAVEGETASALAQRADVSLTKFLKWNEMGSDQKLQAGTYYFLGKKKGRATENFHKVSAGEDLWVISQRYGVQLKRLQRFNRMIGSVSVAPGQMIFLASMRPQSDALKPVEDPVGVDNSETFNWTATSSDGTPKIDTVVIPPATVVQESAPAQTVEVSNPEKSEVRAKEPVVTEPIPLESEPAQDNNPETEVVIQDEPIAEPLPTEKKSEHTVQARETLYSIAKLYNVGVMDLVEWNSLDLQQGLKIGQILKVSAPASGAHVPTARVTPKEVVHEVKSSDTLYSIARQYGVTIKDLMDWNEKKDFTLAVGEKLKIQQRQ
ncbi:MAG TPA: LysM peptidoglycan-binding domain-containing protein [Chryseosolibacter sp.]